MEILLLLLIIPVVWPVIAKHIWDRDINYQEMALQIGIVSMAVVAMFLIANNSQTHDTEIWNGQVVNKTRDHGQWTESYQCNCRTVTRGSGNNRYTTTVCSTCYRKHYTVTWKAHTTVGKVTIEHLDRTSRSVYKSPDPKFYVDINKGDPVSLPKSYENYVKAVHESLFNDKTDEKYLGKIPEYPRIFKHYNINRVLNVGAKVDSKEILSLNERLNLDLRTLGKEKQVNIIVILTGINDPSYRYAVENKWLGGKKNDVIVFLGVNPDHEILWADGMTWAKNMGNELLQVKLRDDLESLKEFNVENVEKVIVSNIKTHYKRPEMKKFEYLKDEIVPSDAAIIWIVLITLLLSGTLTYVFYRNDLN